MSVPTATAPFQYFYVQKNLARRAHAGAILTADRVGKIASKRDACGNRLQ